jgi:hypothetical protein
MAYKINKYFEENFMIAVNSLFSDKGYKENMR